MVEVEYKGIREKHKRTTLGLAKFGQKQYPSALVRYWALARAEVFQFNFLFLHSFSVTILGSGSGQTNFKCPHFAKPYPLSFIFDRPRRLVFYWKNFHIPALALMKPTHSSVIVSLH